MFVECKMTTYNETYIAPFCVIKKNFPDFHPTKYYDFTILLDTTFTRAGQKSTNIKASISFDSSGLKVSSDSTDIGLNERLFHYTEDSEKITIFIGNLGYSAHATINVETNDKSIYFFDSTYGAFTATKATVLYGGGQAPLHYRGTQNGTYLYITPHFAFGTIEVYQNRPGGVANWRTGKIFYDSTNVIVTELVPGSALVSAIYENGQIRVNTYNGSPLTYVEY